MKHSTVFTQPGRIQETAQRAKLSEGGDMTKDDTIGYTDKALSILVHSVDGAAHAIRPCPPAEAQTCLVTI